MYCLSSLISGWARRLRLHQRESAAVSPAIANLWIAPRSFFEWRNLEVWIFRSRNIFRVRGPFGGRGSHPIGLGIFFGWAFRGNRRDSLNSSKNIFRVGGTVWRRRPGALVDRCLAVHESSDSSAVPHRIGARGIACFHRSMIWGFVWKRRST